MARLAPLYDFTKNHLAVQLSQGLTTGIVTFCLVKLFLKGDDGAVCKHKREGGLSGTWLCHLTLHHNLFLPPPPGISSRLPLSLSASTGAHPPACLLGPPGHTLSQPSWEEVGAPSVHSNHKLQTSRGEWGSILRASPPANTSPNNFLLQSPLPCNPTPLQPPFF